MQVGSHHFTGSASEGCPNFLILDESWRECILDLSVGFGTLFDFGHQVTKLMGAEGGKMAVLEEL